MFKKLLILKNNWKKASFATALLGYGVFTTKEYFEISKHMRSICSEVLENADKNRQSGANQRVLVVLNPVANDKKAEKTFKKYCEPILHMAGYSVEILKTNYIGHAKSVLETMQSLPDAIVVAGGDGTSSEVVTGLLRREEAEVCPILFLPLGTKNETACQFLNIKPKTHVEYVKSVSCALYPLLHQKSKYQNVIQYDVIENDADPAKNLKPIYGLTQFSWGLIRDLDAVKDKYWYFGRYRHYAACLFSSFSKDLNWNFATNFLYTPPCEGCKNCVIKKQTQNVPKTYFSKLMPTTTNKEAEKILKLNANCNTITEGQIEACQLNISCQQNNNNNNASTALALETKFIDSLTPGFDFIKRISSITKNNLQPSLVLNSRTIQLIPKLSNDSNQFYSIDGEEYDVRPIKVSLLPKAIKVFC